MTTAHLLAGFCRRVLGPGALITPGFSVHGGSRIVRVRDADGHAYVAKLHTSPDRHRQEVRAYTRWVPVLGPHAPQLVAADAELPAILITAVPGHPADRPATPSVEHHVHRQAGALLRRFHNAEPATPLHGFADHLANRLEHWLSHADGLLTRAEATLVRRHVAALAALPPPDGVPCYLDYQPRNWLVDADGTLHLIDFEHARLDAAPRDLVRLAFRIWPTRPDLREAFLDGYVRPLTKDEQQILTHCGAIDAVTSLMRARDTGDPALAAHGRATLRQLPPSP